jgi:hypothetical protein
LYYLHNLVRSCCIITTSSIGSNPAILADVVRYGIAMARKTEIFDAFINAARCLSAMDNNEYAL